ncbi:unnamed protein product (macronuclear) [Paramecium tetraurelia]|uniref:Uncharacterized protein n=1 Tax=Paramecium tetraurelia TaxID=5888 RepID=A0CI42_PARTE|nr:uncharacterized protein GSPATT00038563001 [Paramecium tetraurelia]CAK70459.1 unnamed protein product [Paramecium tetraurelia]|eukprot:XP_001437856.1 hypothetical protein (macronuclear) [Paramecium tetraurelia strain d4-2]
MNQQVQTKVASQLQFIVPQKAQLIFDVNQAYQAYSLPKIQYRQQLPDVPLKSIRQFDEKQEQSKQKNDNQIFKEWNVNYQEDILLANNKQLKAQQNTDLLDNLRSISKQPPKKKTRMHKTKFKIVKNEKNHPIVEQTMCQYISQKCLFQHQFSIQTQVPGSANNQDYDASAPFFIPTLEFAEQLNEEKQTFKKTKKYGFDDVTLRKNKLILEEVILLRLQKKEKIRQKNQIINQVKKENDFDQQQKNKINIQY